MIISNKKMVNICNNKYYISCVWAVKTNCNILCTSGFRGCINKEYNFNVNIKKCDNCQYRFSCWTEK